VGYGLMQTEVDKGKRGRFLSHFCGRSLWILHAAEDMVLAEHLLLSLSHQP